MKMDYLNQDHPALKREEAKRAFAVDELVKRATQCSHSFRIQFDASRLVRVIGEQKLLKLMPNFVLHDARPSARLYDTYADTLDPERAEILRELLALLPSERYPERPLNYIKSVRFLDAGGATILRGGDFNSFILFALPTNVRQALLSSYHDRDIPADVLEQVDVDVRRLEP